MNERDWADRFSHDVDNLLNKSGRIDFEPLPDDYRDALILARTLATTDFSPASQVRHRLRRRLIEKLDSPAGLRSRRGPIVKPHPSHRLRRRLMVSIAGALALLLAITLLSGGPAVAAQRITDGVKIIVLGAYTTAQRIEAVITGQPLPDDTWQISLFPHAGVGGNGLPGTNPTVSSIKDFEEAQELTEFNVRVPGYLPEGYSLKEIKLAPIWTGAGALLFPSNPNAFLFYVGPGTDIVIVQQPVGPQPIGDLGLSAGQFISFVTDGTLVEVEISNHTAAWADDRLLMWEQGGVSYIVGGLNLGLEEAIRIAVSLQ